MKITTMKPTTTHATITTTLATSARKAHGPAAAGGPTRYSLPATRYFSTAAAALALPLAAAPARTARPPNIVVIVADDYGTMDLGCYNPKTFYETPNLDRLASQGVRFTNGYAACPVCSPTRFSLMTGRYPARVAATDFFDGKGVSEGRADRFLPAERINCMPLDEHTFADGLRSAGYRTYFVGKWHLGYEAKFWPENRGFDINIAGCQAGAPIKSGTAKGYFAPYGNPRLKDGPPGEFLTARLADEAVALLRRAAADKTKPFLLYNCFYSVHTPLQAPEATVEKYRQKAQRLGLGKGDGKINDKDFAPEEQAWQSGNQARQPRRVRIRQNHAIYAAMVEEMDKAAGRILDALDELGLADNTIVIFTSDNGGLSTSEGSPTSNLPYRGGKGWMYEGGIREPWLIRWPGVVKPGATNDTPIISTDVLPTAFAAAGVPLPAGKPIDGCNLVPLLKTGEPPARDALFWHYPHYGNQGGFPSSAVRMGDWKLIQRLEDGRLHLFNIRNDPGEHTDLAAKEPARAAAMLARLQSWRDEVGARYLRQENNNSPKPWAPAAAKTAQSLPLVPEYLRPPDAAASAPGCAALFVPANNGVPLHYTCLSRTGPQISGWDD